MKIISEHIPYMDNLINGGLMRTITPPEIAEQLIKSGHARQAVGGLIATDSGKQIFFTMQKDNK